VRKQKASNELSARILLRRNLSSVKQTAAVEVWNQAY
jgi:hypothetical protein